MQNLPPVFGDAVQVQQVLLNLMMNAMDAMSATPHAHRTVTIRTRERRGGLVEVLVVDRGPGIAEDIRHKVLEPFYTTKEHGLGLGLSICSSMVDAHGGKLTLGNHSAGAVASFTVPRYEMMIAAK
jgi:C4-dicarboxylate-specific signal transduction histidine kinase